MCGKNDYSLDSRLLDEPIWVDENRRLLAFENRYHTHRAAKRTRLPAFIIDIHYYVRHFKTIEGIELLPKSERAYMGSVLLNTAKNHFDDCSDLNSGKIRFDALLATLLGFGSRSSYYHARQVVEKGSPELIAAMDTGNISLYMAYRIAQLSLSQQHHVLADPRRLCNMDKRVKDADEVEIVKQAIADCTAPVNKVIFDPNTLCLRFYFHSNNSSPIKVDVGYHLTHNVPIENIDQVCSIVYRIDIGQSIEKNARKHPRNRRFFALLPGRLDDNIAMLLGFGNRTTYQQAKYVLTHANDSVLGAMNTKLISIYRAYRLAKSATYRATITPRTLVQGKHHSELLARG